LGNVYSFCADGSIRFVAAPKADGFGRFLAMSASLDAHAYLATSDTLYLLLHRQTALKIGPRADFLLRPKALPKYASAFSVDAGHVSYFVWNGMRGAGCFSIAADQVHDPQIILPLTAFGGWADGGALVIFGKALQASPGRTGTVASVGAAAIASISSGESRVLDTMNGLKSESISVDRWHGALLAQGKRILIGVSAEPKPTEDSRTERIPTWHDGTAVVLCSFADSAVECLASLREYGYVQLLRHPSSVLVYLVYLGTHPGPRLRDLKVQAFDPMQHPSVRLEPCEVEGLDSERVLLHVSFSHHPDTGFFGVVSLLKNTSSVEAYAVTGDSGIKWRVVAQLY